MKALRRENLLPAAFAILVAAGCATPQEQPAKAAEYRETLQSLEQKRAIQPQPVSRDLHVYPLEENLWVHRSYFDIGSQRYHSNGLVFAGPDRVTVIDTPWTPVAAHDLLGWLDTNFPGKPVRLVVTHAHDDRLGGIDAFVARGIAVYANRETAELAREQGKTAPNYLFENNLFLRSGDAGIELFHPGAGHAPDNIVAWFPEARLLFGGCMVKSANSTSLGNLEDADEASWPQAVRRAIARYPEVARVVPGHGLPGDARLLTHTVELLED